MEKKVKKTNEKEIAPKKAVAQKEVSSKNSYSDEELQEFKEIILAKLEDAR